MENIFNKISKEENEKTMLNSLEIYEKFLKENLQGKIPTSVEELKYVHK
jgi:hypothetical protein